MSIIRTNSIIRTTSIIRTSGRSSSAIDPLSIITSKMPFFFLSGDLGITLGTGVSAWADQSGNGADATQATGGNQPTYNATDAAFGGRASVQGSAGGGLYLNVNWNPPAPGTTPVWFFLVFQLVVSTNATVIFVGATGSNTLCLLDSGSSSLTQVNTVSTNANTGATAGTSVRGEVFYNNTTSCYTKFGTTTITGGNAGNADGSIFRLLNRNGSTQGSNTKLACIGAWNGEPTSGEKALLDAWCQNYYGSGVVV